MKCNNKQEKKSPFLALPGFAALGLSALLMVTTGCTNSENDRITASVEAPPGLNPREAKALSLAATKVLHETDSARLALQGEMPRPDEALKDIEQGLTLVQIIENTAPWSKVKTEIKAGELAYQDDGEHELLYVPISDTILTVDELIPAKSGTSEADTPQEPPLIERSELGYVALFLDVSLVKEKLETAAKQLREANIEGAGATLLSVPTDGVIYKMAEVDLPLEQAAANLKLAEYDISVDRVDAAEAELKAAADSLKAYELGEGRFAEEARHMHQGIDTLVESLGDATASAQGRNDVEEKIVGWWEEIAEWLGTTG
jgi:hypothetical protein